MNTAIVIGGSGLIGSELLKCLETDTRFSSVIALSRRPLNLSFTKTKVQVVDFNQLENIQLPTGCHYFCCLGTTIKVAQSKEAFYKVDHDYPLALARLAHRLNAASFHLISALGANATSSVYYSKVKGETERDLKQVLGATLRIYQPSLLLGNRDELQQTARPGEKLFQNLSYLLKPAFPILLPGPFKKYRPIEAKEVAASMLANL